MAETYHARVFPRTMVRNLEPNRTTGVEPGGNHPQLQPAAVAAIFNKIGSGKLVRVRGFSYNSLNNATSVAARYLRNVKLITAASDGWRDIPAQACDSNNAALPSQIKLTENPGSVTLSSNVLDAFIDSGFVADFSSTGPHWANDKQPMRHRFPTMDAGTAQRQRIVLREGEGIALESVESYASLRYVMTVVVRNQSSGACYVYGFTLAQFGGVSWSLMNNSGSGIVLEVVSMQLGTESSPFRSGGNGELDYPRVFVERIENLDASTGAAVTPIKLDSANAALPAGVLVREGCMVDIKGLVDQAISVDSSVWGTGMVPWVSNNLLGAQPQRFKLGPQEFFNVSRNAAGSSELDYILREGEGLALIQRPYMVAGQFEFGLQWSVETPAGAVYPGVGDVDSGVTYGPTGADYTGTLVQPAEADVELGVSYGAGGTEFTGTLAGGSCDYPAQGDVQNGVVYGSGVYTGTFVAPAVGDVRNGTGYGAAGTEFSGTLTLPAVGDVQNGVSYGAGGTEFTGTFAWPIVGNVLNGIGYGASGTEFTGTYQTVAVGDVREGTTYGAGGASTGTLRVPAVGNVRNGIGYGSGPGTEFTGNLVLPAVGDVQVGVGYGSSGTESTGTLTLPTIAQTLSGVGYGAGGTEFTGNYVVVAVGDVREGTTFGSLSAQSGTLRVPAVGDVQSGVGYGSGPGTELTGTFAAPAVGDVQSGVGYGAGGVEFSGTFAVPAIGDVKSGVGYGAGGTEFTGTYTASCDYPAQGDVQNGVTYASGTLTGTFVAPAAGDVRTGVGYGAAGTEFVGTITLPTANNVRTGVSYGAGGTELTGNIALPAAGDVRIGISYGANSTELTGTLDPGVGGGTTTVWIARRSR